MEKALKKEVDKLEALTKAVATRRKSWSAMSQRADQCLADFNQYWEEKTKIQHYIECRTNAKGTADITTINSNCISLWAGHQPIGVTEINGKSSSSEIEISGKLLISQMADGNVIVTITPPSSEVKSPYFSNIMIYAPTDPSKISYSKVEKAIRRYLWIQRIFGFRGFPSWTDKPLIFWYWFIGWRHANTWKGWVLFWAALLTFIFAIISTAASIKDLLE